MRVLFLTQRLPYAPNRGDRVRAHYLLRAIRNHGDVHVVSLVHDAEEAAEVKSLDALASSVRVAMVPKRRNTLRSLLALAGRTPLTFTMLDSPAMPRVLEDAVVKVRPDVVLAYCTSMARFALSPPLRGIPLVIDFVDVDSAKWAALADIARPPMSWLYRREALVLRHFEAVASQAAFANIITTTQERQTLCDIAPHARVEVVENGVDVERLQPPAEPSTSADVVFCGVMDYAPNENAAVFLATEIWPLVRRERPEARLKLVGANPTPRVKALADTAESVLVTGTVPDVRPYLWESAVAVAPVRTARGIQNKILEAVAAGLPVVITPNLIPSLPPSVMQACLAGETPAELAAAIVRLLDMAPARRREMAVAAGSHMLTWERRMEGVPDLLREACSRNRNLAVGQ